MNSWSGSGRRCRRRRSGSPRSSGWWRTCSAKWTRCAPTGASCSGGRRRCARGRGVGAGGQESHNSCCNCCLAAAAVCIRCFLPSASPSFHPTPPTAFHPPTHPPPHTQTTTQTNAAVGAPRRARRQGRQRRAPLRCGRLAGWRRPGRRGRRLWLGPALSGGHGGDGGALVAGERDGRGAAEDHAGDTVAGECRGVAGDRVDGWVSGSEGGREGGM